MNKHQIKAMTELAAKAVGYEGVWDDAWGAFLIEMERFCVVWEPYLDDGDSRRLQLDLGLSLEPHSDAMLVYHKQSARWWKELIAEHSSPAEAARVVVLRAASELG